ncbi:MAG: hypothetical protein NXI24_18795 [bacterium]|nr:hypothetical protein [bacterium]
MKFIVTMCGVSPGVLFRILLCPGLALCFTLCTPEGPQPVPGQWDRIYSIGPPELMRYGRSFAVDTLYFRYVSSETGTSSGQSSDSSSSVSPATPSRAVGADLPRLQAGILEFSRGQTPDGFQAEQRGLLYDTLQGFTALSDAGLYPNRQSNVHAPADSARFRFSGRPAMGFLLQDREGEVEIVAPPLKVLRDSQLGLARYTLYAGTVEIRSQDAAKSPAVLVFQRIYLPAINPFDENARLLWAARARLWLAIQDAESASASGGDIVFGREQGEVLNPLFSAGSKTNANAADASDSGDFAFLTRDTDASRSGRSEVSGFESFPAQLRIEPAESGPEFTGDFMLRGDGDAESQTRCSLNLSAVHTVDLLSISRADSRVAAVRGELACPERAYRLQGLMRVWPEAGEAGNDS